MQNIRLAANFFPSLLAATLGPLANVLSIAALVTSWRMSLIPPSGSTNPADLLPDLEGNPFADPRWCYWLNVVSLILGFVGQIFLFCNFTGIIRYIVALPMTILLWYIATAIVSRSLPSPSLQSLEED